MTETYSLAITGVRADSPNAVQNLTLPDSGARPGAQQQAMARGTQQLVKRPDGSSAWYTLDAERSTPSLPVLKPVGP